jgi:hypothetical protein
MDRYRADQYLPVILIAFVGRLQPRLQSIHGRGVRSTAQPEEIRADDSLSTRVLVRLGKLRSKKLSLAP